MKRKVHLPYLLKDRSSVVTDTGNIPSAILIGTISGLAIGLLNGAGIAFGKMPPFVMTLGTTSIEEIRSTAFPCEQYLERTKGQKEWLKYTEIL